MTIWIKELLNQLDENVDEPTRKRILGGCGAKCPFTHLPDEKLLEIKKNSRNDLDFLDSLINQWRVVNEDGQYYVVFDRCYCPLVNEDTDGASKTLCFCTLGNLQHKFEIGLKQDVEIDMLKSILSGDDECRFKIKFKN